MPKTKVLRQNLSPATQRRLRRILRVVARARKTAGMAGGGYTVMLPFSRRLTRNSNPTEFGVGSRRQLVP